MSRKPATAITIDLAPVITSIHALVDRAVNAALLAAVASADKPQKPAKAPRTPKAAKVAAPAAPKPSRMVKGDIREDVARYMDDGTPRAASEIATALRADPASVKRALATLPGIIVSGKARGTKYSLLPMDAPPMGDHVNGTQASA